MTHANNVVIIGAGPAGLTAGYLLSKENVPVTILEADPTYVGGIARTAKYKGYHFDIGGHRFFSKSKEVEDLWTELLPDDMLDRPRSSRIYYRDQFFAYPLKATEALFKLGIFESTRCMLSYLWAKVWPYGDPKNFEEWVSNQFGSRLFNIFFKTYTEKVWGMSCKEISADWAAQRIKGLSLWSAIWNSLFKPASPQAGDDKSNVIKTLIDTFRYPRRGPGMMWDAAAAKIKEMGGEIEMGMKVVACDYDAEEKLWTTTYQDQQGERHKVESRHVISSAPMRQLVNGISPRMHEPVIKAADSLRYRDFLTVVLILKDRSAFDDNWIYIHDPSVQVGRIQNFKSWSPEMVPDPTMTCYGLEYFCFEGDGLWTSTDAELIELGKRELAKIGLAAPEDVVDGTVVRQPKAYPVYDDDYAKHVNTIREELDKNYPNLYLVGRNGMHKYNNQDHAMMTAMLCAKNIVAGEKLFDLWEVNQDAEYHEAGKAGDQQQIASGATGLRAVPTKVKEEAAAAAS
ncbi:MAG: NAD(P)/FAD-dependent oxidoreductase, partial [Planctomycetes bacterium]|nr:NAD(P)/FAD-dependent oxidoreductase [Planctomycetota bacterium]